MHSLLHITNSSGLARRLMTSQTGVNCQQVVKYGAHPRFHPHTEQGAVKYSLMLIHLLAYSVAPLVLYHTLTFAICGLICELY